MKFVTWKNRKKVAADLREIYSTTTVEQAEQRLTEFEEKWGKSHPSIGSSWHNNWARIIPFFDFPPEIRKVIDTTNAIGIYEYELTKSY